MDKYQLRERPVVIHKALLDHYSELGINETEFVILIKLIYASETSNKQPSIEVLQQGTTLPAREITTIIQHLIQTELLELNVNKDEDGKFTEYMNLEPFYEKLSDVIEAAQVNKRQENSKIQFNTLFEQIEQSFGRPLSPFEIENLNQWIDVDGHSFEIIQAALNEAESHNKLSFKYLDRILLNWKKQNVQTIEESKNISQQFNKPKMAHHVKEIPKIDWLNGED
ncbi:DnaD domain-containing protein [Staphylococcus sp. SQ8-PEA]|uniref:DnaD domain-containing protein n=1 Tax=Staphylococcus marylandisciuri TaxID=2981529 RepID=A0ABT2QNF2_9STAP|nr:DnaD domain-containing protein [Staphylococcus marylandisciuri]MCU5745497.1 DnaD domain-containing protein [Staphylococcus marylandisciuri]